MGKKIIWITLSITFLLIVSCKNKKDENNDLTKETIDNKVEIDSTISSNKVISSTKVDTIRNRFSKYSLNDLLEIYGKTLNKNTSTFVRDTIYGEIVKRHEISSDDYAKFRDDFWKQKPTYVHTLDFNNLKSILQNTTSTDYVLFTFSKSKVADDFNYQIVKSHVFNSFVSCFPAVLLKQMIEDAEYQKITVGKGLKNIPKPPYSLPPDDYEVAMLKYFDKDGNVQYFDIVDDPSVSN